MDVGLATTAFLLETAAKTLKRIEQAEERPALAPGFAFVVRLALSLLEVFGFSDAAGRLGLYSTTMSRAAAMMSRRTADSAVRRMPSTSR